MGTQHAQSCGVQQEMRAGTGCKSQPPSREYSQNVSVSKQDHITAHCTHSCDHTIDADADLEFLRQGRRHR